MVGLVIWIVYFVLLLLALLYAGVIIYHITKYRYDDLPREHGYHSSKMIAIYLGVGGIILLLSITLALFTWLF